MAEHKSLGDILLEAGRITPEQVDDALEYQRTHGGYFGEALVAQGFVRPEEVEWALASQFDLPLIFPDPDTVDPDVAALVPPEWSLAHLAVPIVRVDDTLTVVVQNPLDTDVIDELHEWTGLEIELALASPSRIRELVRALYADSATDRAARDRSVVSLNEFMDAALVANAERLGISTRGPAAVGWYVIGDRPAGEGTRVRHRLAPGWWEALEVATEPAPSERAPAGGRGVERWSATLRNGSGRVDVEVQTVAGDGGVEHVFWPVEPVRPVRALDAATTIPASIADELRVLGRAGVRIAFVTDEATAGSVLPRLPLLVWGDDVRAAHLTAGKTPAGIFTLTPASASDPLLDSIEACGFDALTVDLPDDYPLDRIVASAPTVVVRVREPDRSEDIDDLGIGWILELDADDDGVPEWELRPAGD